MASLEFPPPAPPPQTPTRVESSRSTEATTRIGPLAFDIQPYPLPDEHGALRWSRSFTLEEWEAHATAPWTEHVVVFHGMTINGSYDQLLPVACGAIQPV